MSVCECMCISDCILGIVCDIVSIGMSGCVLLSICMFVLSRLFRWKDFSLLMMNSRKALKKFCPK